MKNCFNDEIVPVMAPEDADELIVFEEVVSGDTEVTIAIPSEIKVRNVKKRKQLAITDYFAKKINKK